MNTIFSRLKEYVDSLGISNNEFGRVIGCSSAQVTQMLTHEKNFGVDKLLKIFSGYPSLNPDWLLTGNGPMLRDNKTSKKANGVVHQLLRQFLLPKNPLYIKCIRRKRLKLKN